MEVKYLTTPWNNISARAEYLASDLKLLKEYGPGANWGKAITEELEEMSKRIDKLERNKEEVNEK